MQWTRGRLSRGRGLVLGATGGLLVLAACEAKLPTSADVAEMDVASAQRSAAQSGFMRTPASDATDFFVNGAKVTAEQARALQAKIIGSIEVVKSEQPTGRDTIFVTTVDRMPKGPDAGLQARERDREGKVGQESGLTRIVRDSGEHMVGHVERELAKMRAAGEQQPTRVRMRDGVQPVYLIDGRKATMAEVSALKGSDIRSVNVYKKDGTGIDPDGANGVISIETKPKKQ